MEIYLIRHTAVQATGLCYGHHDVALADTFATEAAQLLAKLPPAPAGGYRAFSSPAARCRVLAEAVTPAPITADERLREMNFGAWENRPWNDLPPAETAPWMADFVTLTPPGGETFGAVQQRAAAFLAELAATAAAPAPTAPVLVFTHGGTIRALVAHCLEMPLHNAFQLHIDFASVTKLRLQHGRWNLLALNG